MLPSSSRLQDPASPEEALEKPKFVLPILTIAGLLAFGVMATRSARLAQSSPEASAVGERARALQERQRYEPADPTGPVSFRDLFAAREPEEVLATLDAALRLAPTWALHHHARAVALLELDREDEAAVAFRRASRFAPTYAELQFQAFLAWLGHARKTGEPLHLLRSISPLRAASLLHSRLLDEGLDRLEALVPDPEDLAPLVPDDADAQRAFARRLLRGGRSALAREHFRRALSLCPEQDAVFFRELGLACLAERDLPATAEAFLAFVSRSRDRNDAVRSLYPIYLRAGQADEGARLWKEWEERFPLGARFNRARHSLAQGNLFDAHEEFLFLARAAPSPEVEVLILEILTGREWSAFAEAEERARRALLRWPGHPELHRLRERAIEGLERNRRPSHGTGVPDGNRRGK